MAEFNRRFQEAVKDIPDLELARTFRISLPTVRRWKSGESAPHPLGQESVFEHLRELQEEKI